MGVEFQTHGRYESDLRVGIPGKFNVDNALAAAGVCSFFDLPKEKVCHALEHIQVDGRMEIVYKSAKCTVIVDYAHNAVSMESLLLTLRDYKPEASRLRLRMAADKSGARSPVLDGRDWRKAGRSVDHHGG